MRRREFMKTFGIGVAAIASGAAHPQATRGAEPATAKRKPNIIYIILDELGYYELSCMGHKTHKTPNIDRMVTEGVRFTQALAGGPVCGPTRCCLMTGKHMGHSSMRTNPGGAAMRADEETVASVLKRAGYATGGFGKWGVGDTGTTGVPEKHGFDVFFGYYHQVHAHNYYPKHLIRNSEIVPLEGNPGGRGQQGKTFSHQAIYDESIAFIKANKDKPFFCYLPWTPPHGLWNMPPDDPSLKHFQDVPAGPARVYAAMINMVDRQIGEIFALLKKLKIDEETLVFVCGDNGANAYFKNAEHPRGIFSPNVDPRGKAGEFRGGKGSVYEGGLRIPMVVRWPGKIKPGRLSDHLWYFPDVLPTLAEIAGAKTPAGLDGISVVPTLLDDGRKQVNHEYLYWIYGGSQAVRMGHWKLVITRKKKNELYDLSKDIAETINVAAEHPDILKKMLAFAAAAYEPARPGTVLDPTKLYKRSPKPPSKRKKKR